MTDPQQPARPADPLVPPPAASGPGLSVAALVLGIIGIVVGIVPLVGLFLSFVPTVLALVLGVLGMVRSGAGRPGFAPALAGVVLGGTTFLLWFTGYGLLW